MKTLFTFLFVTVLLPLKGHAQIFDRVQSPTYDYTSGVEREQARPGLKPFVKAGVALSDWSDSRVKGIDTRLGYMVEAGLEIPFKNPMYGIQPSVRLMSKGAKVDYDRGGKARIEQGTLELPVLVTGRLSVGNKTWLKVGFGPYLAWGVYGTTKTRDGNFSTFGSGYDGFYIRKFDVGIAADMSLELKKIIFGMGADVGFVPVRPADDNWDPYPRNSSVFFYVGYNFRAP